MSNTEEVTFETPARKASAKKKPARRVAPPQARSSEAFPGLTRTVCAEGCNTKGCVISQKPYCAHPTKGGLQAGDMNNPAALKRLQQARAQIDVRIDPDRFK